MRLFYFPLVFLFTAAAFGAPGLWNTDTGQWEVGNHGVAPDIEIDQDPELVRQGHDPQLEKAVQIVLDELAKHPIPEPKHPQFSNYHCSEAGLK